MMNALDRRGFLKTAGGAAAGLGLSPAWNAALAAAVEKGPGCPRAENLGWRLGCQAYSFNRFTFFEAVDKNAALGLKWLEAYPGQRFSAEKNDVKFNHDAPAEIRQEAKKKLADSGVKVVNYGVVGLPNVEADCRKVFEFAKDMGIETIVSEPKLEALPLIDKLCNEYGINCALHNHPKPSFYWNPETVREACKERSKRIGSCADTGHWMRSGIAPLEALKKLEGHIVSFHFKDLNKMGDGTRQPHEVIHDVPWGSGAADARGLLQEIKRQGIKAVFSIEYEYNWMESVPEIAQCVAFFDKVAAELGG